jgi:hypothetical protein
MKLALYLVCLSSVAISTAATAAPPVTITDPTNAFGAQVDVNGLHVVCSSCSGGGGGVVTQGTTPWIDNVSQFGGSNVVNGTGVSGAGVPRVTVSSDSTVGLTGTLPAFAAPPSVVNAGTFAVQNTAATPAGTNTIGAITGFLGNVDSTTNLGASATFTGTGRAPPAWAVRFGCRATSAQSGTLEISESISSQTPVIATQALTGGQAVDLSVYVRGATNYLCVYINGSTAQTQFSLEDSFTAN